MAISLKYTLDRRPLYNKSVNMFNLFNTVEKITKEKYAIRKIIRYIRIISSLIYMVYATRDVFQLRISNLVIPCNLWNENFRKYLNENLLYIILGWATYEVVLTRIIRRVLIRIERKSLPYLFTLDDVISFFNASFIFLYVINKIIELYNGVDVCNKYDAYISAFLISYPFYIFIRWIFMQNSIGWNDIIKKYTNYYDSNGNRIPEDAHVIYYGKRYRINDQNSVIHAPEGNKKREIYLHSVDNEINKEAKRELTLEEAARNYEGHLMLDTWNLGE